MVEVRLPMLEYDFSKQPDQGFDEFTGEHGGYEMGVRGSSKYFPIFSREIASNDLSFQLQYILTYQCIMLVT